MKSSAGPEDAHHKTNSNKPVMNAVYRLFPIGSKVRALKRKGAGTQADRYCEGLVVRFQEIARNRAMALPAPTR